MVEAGVAHHEGERAGFAGSHPSACPGVAQEVPGGEGVVAALGVSDQLAVQQVCLLRAWAGHEVGHGQAEPGPEGAGVRTGYRFPEGVERGQQPFGVPAGEVLVEQQCERVQALRDGFFPRLVDQADLQERERGAGASGEQVGDHVDLAAFA
ncbi:hypothetical protein [Peterkaempfera bronchialis]|uniref:Uncharacterized protein n=1 Tax=Peterkaempfera bronchialis TaxID=2126346 RepID=A0A345SUR8_9ACTN|nr:hypothetical protein [Peterkaempfera bronchialis]AXI77473.1 hypothetical protein C7M71_008495 [Peterkaempfera bronchialis]